MVGRAAGGPLAVGERICYNGKNRIKGETEMEQRAQMPRRVPAWKVYFEGGLRSRGREHCGREIRLDALLDAPTGLTLFALYRCSRGLCALVGRSASAQALAEHRRLLREAGDRVRRMELEALDPLGLCVQAQAVVNGKTLHWNGATGLYWEPGDGQEGSDPEARSALEHFGLDPARGWAFELITLPWATRHSPRWQGCTLTIQPSPRRRAVPAFWCQGAGQTHRFTDPFTGRAHTLTVHRQEAQSVDAQIFQDPEQFEYPTHYQMVGYTVEPPLPGRIHLSDCDPGDRPRRRCPPPISDLAAKYGLTPTAENDVSIGIIGGVDGPVLVTVGQEGRRQDLQWDSSELHFEPRDGVRWQPILQEAQPAGWQVQVTADGQVQGSARRVAPGKIG